MIPLVFQQHAISKSGKIETKIVRLLANVGNFLAAAPVVDRCGRFWRHWITPGLPLDYALVPQGGDILGSISQFPQNRSGMFSQGRSGAGGF